jgi:serine/threonine-protein kinase
MKKQVGRQGMKFEKWVLVDFIDAGGNGEVWKAIDGQRAEYAIKILTRISPKAYDRFYDEIKIVDTNSDVKGILPIIYYLPKPTKDLVMVWYVMPLAVPFVKWAENKGAQEIVLAIISIAETMSILHKRDINHRDIKPANLFYLGNCYYIGDFGLVEYPTKKDLTHKGETIGPKWTMAPEMKRFAEKAKGGPADVYSLAKTLWILLTKEKKGFEGQYVINSSIELKKYQNEIYVQPLDDLLFNSTDNDPAKRPTMAQFVEKLREWVELEKDYDKQNKDEWRRIQQQIFPAAIPQRVFWKDANQIIIILNILGNSKNFNHTFFPDGGGLDLESAKLSIEKACIELRCNSLVYIVKPLRLIFESFSEDPQWNYFRLETGGLDPIEERIKDNDFSFEVFTEISPGKYVEYSAWDNDEYNGKPLPDTARPVARYFKGDFVIFCKKSYYNKDHSTYDGRHNKMTTEQFRKYIELCIKKMAEIKREDKERTQLS